MSKADSDAWSLPGKRAQSGKKVESQVPASSAGAVIGKEDGSRNCA